VVQEQPPSSLLLPPLGLYYTCRERKEDGAMPYLEDDAASSVTADGDVEEDAGVGHVDEMWCSDNKKIDNPPTTSLWLISIIFDFPLAPVII
jgi:hypothetical protein